MPVFQLLLFNQFQQFLIERIHLLSAMFRPEKLENIKWTVLALCFKLSSCNFADHYLVCDIKPPILFSPIFYINFSQF